MFHFRHEKVDKDFDSDWRFRLNSIGLNEYCGTTVLQFNDGTRRSVQRQMAASGCRRVAVTTSLNAYYLAQLARAAARWSNGMPIPEPDPVESRRIDWRDNDEIAWASE